MSTKPPTYSDRLQQHRNLVKGLCQEVCDQQGLGYISWECVVHGSSKPSTYSAVAGDGEKTHIIPLEGKALDLAQSMEKWVASGAGPSPAVAWLAKRVASLPDDADAARQEHSASR